MMPRCDIEALQEENTILKETVSYLEIVLKKAKERRNNDCRILVKKLLEAKPELTWEELKEWVRKDFSQKLIDNGETLNMYSKDFFFINNMMFVSCGNILTNGRCYIAEKKTPSQMKTIIEALWG